MFRVVDDWVMKAARTRPEHPAVEAAEGALTYAELDREADLAARRLTALGVGPRARVAATLAPGIDFAVLLHALPRVGAALVPLNTRLPAEQQDRQRELAGAGLLVEEPLGGSTGPAGSGATRELDPAAVHTVLFTSGTSGEPRPVELTLANHDASAAGSTAALGTEPADRWLCPLPLFHVGGLAILLRCARAGTTAVLHERFDAQHVAADLAGGSSCSSARYGSYRKTRPRFPPVISLSRPAPSSSPTRLFAVWNATSRLSLTRLTLTRGRSKSRSRRRMPLRPVRSPTTARWRSRSSRIALAVAVASVAVSPTPRKKNRIQPSQSPRCRIAVRRS